LLHTFYDIAETLASNTNALLPEGGKSEPTQMPDLGSLSKGVREFVEAGISKAKKEA
jgi:hypothetical protein